MSRRSRIPAVLLFTAAILITPFAKAEDLLDVHVQAIQHDPQLRSAKAAFEAVLEERVQARALLRPSVTTGAGLVREWADDGSKGAGNQYHLTLSQPLYLREACIQAGQADSRIARAEAELEKVGQELRLRVSTAYFEVLTMLDNLELIRAERLAVSRQLELVQQRFSVGFSTIIEIHEAQARHDLTLAAEIAAEDQLANSREVLREITGLYHENLAGLGDELPLVDPDPAVVDPWVETALQRNQQLAALRHEMEMVRLEASRRQAARYPRLSAIASYRDGNRSSDFETDSAGRTQIGIQLDAQLYQGGRISSQVRQARSLHVQTREKLEEARRAVEREVRSAFFGVMAKVSHVKALQQAHRSSEMALEATRAGFEAGTRTVLEVLDSQRELYRTRRDYTRARHEYLLETLRLKKAAGTIQDSDLQGINSMLR